MKIASDKLALAAEQKLKEKEYWIKKLSGNFNKSSFPYDWAKGDHRGSGFGLKKFKFPGELSLQLISLSNSVDVKLHMILVTALIILLNKYTWNKDIMVGSPILRQEIEADFINTILVFRSQVRDDMSFKELLLQVRETIIEANENQNYPLELLLEQLNISVLREGFSGFDVVVLLENLHDKKYILNVHYNLLFSFLREDSSITVDLEFNSALYMESTIERIFNHYLNIMEQVLFNINVPLGHIEPMSGEEKTRLLLDFNSERTELPQHKCLPDLFETQSIRTPDHISVIAKESHGNSDHMFISFDALKTKTNQLSLQLKSKGVTRSRIVAIMVDPSIDMIIGLLGILKSGGAYLPLVSDYPWRRIDFILADSCSNLMVTTKSFSKKMDELKKGDNPGWPATLYIEDSGKSRPVPFFDEPEQSCQAPEAKSSSLAYVIYTSGSTGRPKGVMVDHRNAVAYLTAFYREFEIKSDTTSIQLASYSFDLFVEEILAVLLKGGKIVIPTKSEALEFDVLSRLILRFNVNIIDCTPLLLAEFNKRWKDIDINSSGKSYTFISGGDVLRMEYVNHLLSIGSVFNTYGPTESTVCVTYYKLLETEKRTNIPIGKPIANYNVYILEEKGKPVPIGVTGELCVSGAGITRGYMNRPDLTGEKFVEHPFNPGERLYKTGDIARWFSDGNIEFMGRNDNQVKIRGFRIETGEIENHLLSREEIKETAVVVRSNNDDDKYLCAYVVSDRNLDIEGLRESLRTELPGFMIPSFIMQLEHLPLTTEGKIDTSSLPEPELNAKHEYMAPQNPVQEQIRQIWKSVLDLEPIGIHDDFFSIGGHSLKGIQVLNDIHREFDVRIPLAEMFKRPTIKALSDYIDGAGKDEFRTIRAVEKQEYYALSSAQRRMYVLQRMNPESTAYNMPRVITLEEKIDEENLVQAFKRLIARHEGLRTSFEIIRGESFQRIHEKIAFDILWEKESPAGNTIENFVRPFNLSRAPLLRVGLLKNMDDVQILFLDLHHIITDAISHVLLLNDFLTLYRDEALPGLRIQYKDYAEWQKRTKETDAHKKQEAYWLEEFEGEIPALHMPVDFKRPTIQSFEGDFIDFTLDSAQSTTLTAFSTMESVSLYVLLLAIFNVLLAKLSGQEDIIIGTPVMGRNHTDLHQVVGMFVNTLALRNFPQTSRGFKDFLQQVRERTLTAFDNQDYQFEDLVEKVISNRDTGRNPIFDVMFSFEIEEDRAEDFLKLRRSQTESSYALEYRISKFDLTLAVIERGKELNFVFHYCRKLFKTETIRRFIQYFKKSVGSIIENPSQRISDIEIIPELEKKRLLDEWFEQGISYPEEKTIPQLFMEQADRQSQRIALTLDSRQLTYNALHIGSNRLAHHLKSKGVTVDEIVGILLEPSLEMLIGISGILKAGGAYLPIDPDSPLQRIIYMLEDSHTRILITHRDIQKQRGELNNWEGESIFLSEIIDTSQLDRAELSQSADLIPPGSLTPMNMAYCIYTSGTTGNPKGVLIEHKNVVRLLFNDKNSFDFSTRDVWTMFHSYCFDFSVWEIYGALLYGGRLVIIPRIVARDSTGFFSLLKREHVTILNQTPSAFYNLMGVALTKELKRLYLRYVIFGGEALKPVKLKEWRRLYPYVTLINMYGITETTVHVTYKEIGDEEINSDISNIGKPIPTLTAYITDKNRRLVPIGVTGELCVGGEGVGRGYLNRVEWTDKRFKLNRYKKDERLYYSGDLVRMLVDGDMEYLGRRDQQVKIRGYRIEPGEIENQILGYHSIKEVIVVDREDADGEKYLIAYLVPDSIDSPGGEIDKEEFTISELRTYLSERLPDYMRPAHFVLLDRIPLTPNGKIDRKALPEPQFETRKEQSAPADDLEELLVSIWSEILFLDEEVISTDADFFDLGGHSLRATIMVDRIHKELDVRLPLAEIFKTPTIKGLSDFIRSSTGEKYTSIPAAEEREYYELSSAQKRLYVLHQMDSKTTVYNIPHVEITNQGVDEGRLERTFRHLIARHESFRTAFVTINELPVFRILKTVSFGIEHYDSAEDPRKKRAGHDGAETIYRKFVRPFELSKAPLFRVGAAQLEENNRLLMVDMHHIISDGTSMQVLLREFIELYDGRALPAIRVQYKEYARWQNSKIMKEKLKNQEKYWLKEFSGEIQELDLPVDFLHPNVQSFAGNVVNFELGEEETLSLKTVAKRHGTTLYMLLISVFYILLSRLSGQQDIIIGTPVAGRRHSDFERVIGMFVNTLPLRNYPVGEKKFKNFLGEVKERTLNAFENQEYQFEDLVERLNVKRDETRNPLFNVMFVLQNLEKGAVERPVKPVIDDNFKDLAFIGVTSKFDLTLILTELETRLPGAIEYRTNIFKRETIERFIGYLKDIIVKVIEDDDIALKDIDIAHDLGTAQVDIPETDFAF